MRRMMMPLRYVSSLAAPMRSHGDITPKSAPLEACDGKPMPAHISAGSGRPEPVRRYLAEQGPAVSRVMLTLTTSPLGDG
jgi:hypothetical protein